MVRLSSDATADSQDDYRIKIEALRQEFGVNWLSQLGDQSWRNSHHTEMQHNEALAHPSLHRANTTAVASSGRTLG